MSYRMRISRRSSKAGRFIARVHKELQNAFSASGMTQQELANKLEVNRATVNKRLLGTENLTLRSVADLAWALDANIKFEVEPQSMSAGGNLYQPYLTSTSPSSAHVVAKTPVTSSGGASKGQLAVAENV